MGGDEDWGAKGGDGGGQGFHAETGPEGLQERNMLFYAFFSIEYFKIKPCYIVTTVTTY